MKRPTLRNPRHLVRQWRDFRARQLELLRESNRPQGAREGADPTSAGMPLRDLFDAAPSDLSPDQGESSTDSPAPPSVEDATGPDSPRYGVAGRPLSRTTPFYVGFVGALGVLTAIMLWNAAGQLATTLTILMVSFFLTLALNPLVEALTVRMPRSAAVAVVFAALLLVFTLIGWLVFPPVVAQGSDLIQRAPLYVDNLIDLPWVRSLDADYQVVEKFQTEFNRRLTDQDFLQTVLGGILGAGKVVATGIFTTLTVLILTLYFLASLPAMKASAYALIPASRRPRVASLSEEMMRRVGSYAIGQVGIAAFNAWCSWIVMSILGIPYTAVLAVAVGILGLIPLIGATLGAAIVSIVAFFVEPKLAVVMIIYYVIYQQIENYVIYPRVMQRTVSVPGAVTVVAALAGGTLLGVFGALLAIPVAAALLLIYEEVLVPRQARS